MLDGITREAEITKKVLAAVPDAASSYKPDPAARTAKELAWHIASSDVHFLDGIADLNFATSGRAPEQPQTTAEVVAWYDANIKRGVARVGAMTPEQLLTPSIFLAYSIFRRCFTSASSTTTAFIIVENWRLICVPWDRRCRQFMAGATTSLSSRRQRQGMRREILLLSVCKPPARAAFFFRHSSRKKRV